MSISFRAAENGFTHVCAHRGFSLRYPENTLVAFEAAKAAGATTCEIDLMLTRDGEAVVIHDATLNRTTDGHGFVGDRDFPEIRKLNAGVAFAAESKPPVPTFAEVVDWAKAANMGLVVEMKERERPDDLIDRALEVLRARNGFGNTMMLSFDHVDLKRIKAKEPRVRTEAIVHARHADLIGVLRACAADSVSIELEMFKAEDAEVLHAAGLSNRVHTPRPSELAEYWESGRDPRAAIGAWLSAGLIDSLSGDDVTFLRRLVEQNPIVARDQKGARAVA